MDALIQSWPELLSGFWVTLQLLVISGVLASILGLIVVTMRISPVSSFRAFATGYTEVLRNTPLTLVLFFCAFVLPYLGTQFENLNSQQTYFLFAIIGLSLYTSPFIAEALRSGVNGVPVGQAEAARSIGLPFGQTLALVVLPQAIRMVIPPLINVFIALTKNTSVAGGFAVIELFAASRGVINSFGDSVIPVLTGVAVLYLCITIPLGLIAGRIENKLVVLR